MSQNITLSAANGMNIRMYGTARCKVDFEFPHAFVWNLMVADVSKPIIGADFHEYYHLLPDLKEKRLINGEVIPQLKMQRNGYQTI